MIDKEFVSNNQEKLSENTADSDEEEFYDENLWSYEKLIEIPKDKELLKKKVYKYYDLHCLCLGQGKEYIPYIERIRYKMQKANSPEDIWNLKFTPEEATLIFDNTIGSQWITRLLEFRPRSYKITSALSNVSVKYSAKIEYDDHGKVLSIATPLELFTKDVTILEIAIIMDKLMAEEIARTEE